MAGVLGFSDWGSLSNDVSTGYTFNAREQTNGWSGFFGDALGAWVNVEAIKAQANAGADAQAAARNATTYPTGAPANYADTGRAAVGGINGQTLVIGGVLLVAALLVLK
ncbi:hypothetical protein QLQ85_08860 [Halomonas sp. M4R5S39]|uniref:hypothetical protein n=1 Tax=Halomonas kalidii TaxID=3043293 RepID=UPI0024A96AC5|nr:hypothetical protein [Halomonas kalidii]MDI5984900.1 hypothetical protein [Halomonas kalidii]